ncbi:VWA domain-containing protein [Candidatus Gracilibacteria bacterium]|nr:VWA domain-containing protein [Candidatus Gracilibacteria bacterium]
MASRPTRFSSTATINPRNGWANYIYQVVTRYADRVQHYQIWNEFNDEVQYWPGTPEQFARLVEVTAEATRLAEQQTAQDVQLVLGGLSDIRGFSGGSERTLAMLAALRNPSLSGQPYLNYVDAYAVHKYVAPWGTFEWLHWARSQGQLNDGKPFWVTESGVNVCNHDLVRVGTTCAQDSTAEASLTPTEQARAEQLRADYAIQHTAYLLANGAPEGIARFFHFQYDDTADNTGLYTGTTGFKDTSVRPMYAAFELLNEYLGDAQPITPAGRSSPLLFTPPLTANVDYGHGSAHQEIAFASPSQGRVTVVWATADAAAAGGATSITVQVPTTPGASGAQLIWLDGLSRQQTALTPTGNSYTVSLPVRTNSAISGTPYLLVEPLATSSTIDTALLIDSSGSMTSNDPGNRRLDAAQAYLLAALAGDYVGVVDFDTTARTASPLVELPANRDALTTAIGTIDSSGGTNIGAAVQQGCAVLQQSSSANTTKAAILLTDGDGSYADEVTVLYR